MTSVPVLVMTRLTCSLPSASVSVVVWVVTLAPSTRAVWVAVTVETTSRTASMLRLTDSEPSAARSVTVFTVLATPSMICCEVSVIICFCWVEPFAMVSVTVSVTVVTPSTICVAVSVTEATTVLAAFFTRAVPLLRP